MTYYSLDDIKNVNEEIERLQPLIANICKNKKPSWDLFLNVIVPIEIYLHSESNQYGLGFMTISASIKKYYCEFFVNYLKENKIINFSNYMEAFRWIGRNINCIKCNCYETGPTKCMYCYDHWYEIFKYDYNFDYNKLFSDKGKHTLKSKYKTQLPQKILKLVYSFNYSLEEETIMDKYTKKQLTQLLKKNYCPDYYVYDKSIKYYWVKAYIKTKKWAFNTFAIKSRFDYYILQYIRSYL